jgi:hypothetical protein
MPSLTVSFPDQMHVERIREALWRRPEFGQAAVLVGAGFSRNAERARYGAPPFPLWGDLGKCIVDKLYPPIHCEQHDRENALNQVKSTSGALRLAEEFEAAFGRDALHRFLLKEIADEDYRPGSLHHQLLELPWADVFTTNYDTLLEKAAKQVVGRRYDVVSSIEEIPAAMKPRIIKLNGSFPSTRPFILTQEDFRTYPRRYAGFVNLAQQAMMENVFCLVGFSGDDPNFLYWTGWVRDHLGRSAPQIYWCGILRLNTAKRNLLHDRNVVPIDLSPVFPEADYPDRDRRHAMAIEWFLWCLAAGRPRNPLLWPLGARSPITPPAGFPAIVGPSDPHPQPSRLFPDPQRPMYPQVREQVRAWADERRLYPGWVIAPYAKREIIWDRTQGWIERICACLPEMGAEEERPGATPRPEKAVLERLTALDELNWRLETALVPLFPPLVEAIVGCLEEGNPFHGVLDLAQTTVAMTPDNLGSSEWLGARQVWRRLAFAVARFYREERSHAEFDRWIERIRTAVRDYPEQQPRLCYERCLAALGKMDDEAVTAALRDWPRTSEDAIWSVRQAAVLAEIGRLQEAQTLTESALQELRAQTAGRSEEIRNLSREGWTMRLLSTLRRALTTAQDPLSEYRSRLEQLTRHHCDPYPETEFLESKLDQPIPPQRPRTTVRAGFQPGTQTWSHHGGDDHPTKLLPAYQFMRLTEEAPYPPRCGNLVLSEKLLEHIARWFSKHDIVRTLTIISRLASTNVVEAFLTRHRLAALPMEGIQELHAIGTYAIREGIRRVPVAGNPRESRVVERALQRLIAGISILARVVVRLPPPCLDEVFTLALEVYSSIAARQQLSLPRELEELFRSLVLAMPRETLQARALELFSLPVPGSRSFPVELPRDWPEPAFDLPKRLQSLERLASDEAWTRMIAELLEAAGEDQEAGRTNALGRLVVLYRFNVLTNSELRQLNRLLWRRVNPATGLPELPGLQKWTCLTLPAPPSVSVIDLFRRYMEQGDLLRFTQVETGSDGIARRQFTAHVNPDAYVLDWLGATRIPGSRPEPRRKFVNWTRADAATLLRKLRGWWDEEGRDLLGTTTGPSFFVSLRDVLIRNRLELILEALREIVIPRARTGTPLADEVLAFVSDMDNRNVAVEVVLPALLHLDPRRERETASRLRRALAAHNEERQRAALSALGNWLRNQAGSPLAVRGYRLPRMPENLLQELGSIIANRRQPGLLDTLRFAITVLEHFPERANRRFIESLTVGLDSLFEETQYRPNDEPVGHVPYEDVPVFRLLAARVANLLAVVHGVRSEVVDRWIEAAQTDPLPEVRQAVTATAEQWLVEE